jgi:hypothetical protein
MPLQSGKILFHPARGKPVEAKITVDSRYSVKGLPIGEYRVVVEAKGVPAKYASVKTSAIRVTVKKGANLWNVELFE